MSIWDLFKIALRSLRANKLRTFLTMLGIIIGVASVISMISLGEGARRQTLSTIAKFGTNIITVKPGEKKNRHVSSGKVETLMLDDAYAIREYVPNITGVAAQAYQNGQLKFGNKNSNSTVRGTGKDYVWMANFKIAEGLSVCDGRDSTSRAIAITLSWPPAAVLMAAGPKNSIRGL